LTSTGRIYPQEAPRHCCSHPHCAGQQSPTLHSLNTQKNLLTIANNEEIHTLLHDACTVLPSPPIPAGIISGLLYSALEHIPQSITHLQSSSVPAEIIWLLYPPSIHHPPCCLRLNCCCFFLYHIGCICMACWDWDRLPLAMLLYSTSSLVTCTLYALSYSACTLILSMQSHILHACDITMHICPTKPSSKSFFTQDQHLQGKPL